MFSFRLSNKLFFAIIAFFLLFTACNTTTTDETPVFTTTKDYDYQIVYDWNELFLKIERYQAGYRPGPGPRALAYMGLSAYEACLPGMTGFNSIALTPLPSATSGAVYHWPTVINASNNYLMPLFFGGATNNQLLDIKSLYNKNDAIFKSQIPADVYDRSVQRGLDVAKAIWDWSKTDKVGHEHYKDPFQGYDWKQYYKQDGDWYPTVPGPGKAIGGVWGSVKTFAISDQEKICRPPLAYTTNKTSKLYAQALETYSQNTPTLSYEDAWVGEFWSDDIVGLTFGPGPRWIAIGDQVLASQKSNLETAIFMSAKVGVALHDASVACWKSKYYYNFERPQQYINRLIDSKWKPALFNPLNGDTGITPSFPAYPSGHACTAAAAAEALASIFGYSYAMTDNCHQGRTEFEGKPRAFTSFLEMAQENAWSRVPLGAHFRMDAEEGIRFGQEVGRKVNNLHWKK